MSAKAWLNLALILGRLLLWVTGKIDQVTWENSGYRKAFLDMLAVTNARVADMKTIKEENQKKTDEELDQILS